MSCNHLSGRAGRWLAYAFAAVSLGCAPAIHAATNAQATINIDIANPGTQMSPDLYGIFYEDISFGADGGLYAEMVQNRSFDYSSADRSSWNSLTSWTLVQRGGGSAAIATETTSPLNANNQSYLKLTITTPGTGVGVSNSGFFGFSIKAGETYDFSFWARRTASLTEPFSIRLESTGGTLYAEAQISPITANWQKYTATLTPNTTDKNARLVVLTKGSGTVYMDMVSLFPRKTWNNRPNGMRYDLAKLIADLKPRFMRFPGGCVVHGDSVANSYRWKDTIGPIEERKSNFNRWDYHQSYGMGFHEYFQFCEDIGAKPIPILSAGVSCQFEGIKDSVPMDQMGPWVQDALDLIEYANGPVTSFWGAKRAANGHPEPFNLEYIGIGNEEHDNGSFPQGTRFKERFPLFNSAIRAAYPNIKIISHAGPYASDYHGLWSFARSLSVDLVDEHYYMDINWFLNNSRRYDNYQRTGPKVMAGEYASQGNTLAHAVAEASYMTGLERNSDVVRLAAYAPLLCNVNNQNWTPDLIWFDTSTSYGSPNYYVQRMYSNNLGDIYLPSIYTYTAAEDGSTLDGAIGLASWNTKVEYDDVSVVSGTTTLFSDNFSSGTTKWTPNGGTWAISSGVYAQTSTATPARSIGNYTVTGKSSYTYTLRARKTSGAEGFLIAFGYQNSNDYYWWNLGGWGNARHAVELSQGGAKTSLATATGSINTNQWYNIRIQIDGKRIRCYLDDVLIHDISSTGSSGLPNPPIAISANKETASGDVILKLVNPTKYATDATVNLLNIPPVDQLADLEVLTGDGAATNSITSPNNVVSTTSQVSVSPSFRYTMPAWSVNVFRIKPAGSSDPHGLRGAYYDNADFTALRFVRDDSTVDFDWGTGTPGAGINPGTYSVRWTGKVTPKYSETYTFYTTSSDGVRLWVNGQLIVNDWTTHSAATNSGSIALQANTPYDIRLDYFKNSGSAVVKLEWSSASQARQAIPSTSLTPPDVVSVDNIQQARSQPDGTAVEFTKTVTLAPTSSGSRVANPAFFYVSETDRSDAIRVEHSALTSDSLAVDSLATVKGALSTNSAGERCIIPISNPTSTSGTAMKPLGMSAKSVQKDTIGVARLVTIWGRVREIAADKSAFTVSDGYSQSNLDSPTKILVYGDSNINMINPDDFVTVTGVVSRVAGELSNVVICRTLKSHSYNYPQNPPYSWSCGFEAGEGYVLGPAGGQPASGAVWAMNTWNPTSATTDALKVVSSSTDPVATGSNAVKMFLASNRSGSWWQCITGLVATVPGLSDAALMKYSVWKFKLRLPGGETVYNGATVPNYAFTQFFCHSSNRYMDIGQDPDNTPLDLNFHGVLHNETPRRTGDPGAAIVGGRYVEVVVYDDYINHRRSMWYDGNLVLEQADIGSADRFGNQMSIWYGTAYPFASVTGLSQPIYIDDVYLGWDYN